MAAVFLKLCKWEEAVHFCTEAMDKAPGHQVNLTKAFFRRAEGYRGLGKYAEALVRSKRRRILSYVDSLWFIVLNSCGGGGNNCRRMQKFF